MAHLLIAKVFQQVVIRESKAAKTQQRGWTSGGDLRVPHAQFLFLKELWLSCFDANLHYLLPGEFFLITNSSINRKLLIN